MRFPACWPLLIRLGLHQLSSFKFMLPKNFNIELSGSYASKMLMGVFNIKPVWQTDIGITKQFFKNTLILTCTLEDIFYTGYNTLTIYFQGQDVYFTHKDENRKLWIKLRYNFGQTQQKRKSGYKSASDDLQRRTK